MNNFLYFYSNEYRQNTIEFLPKKEKAQHDFIKLNILNACKRKEQADAVGLN